MHHMKKIFFGIFAAISLIGSAGCAIAADDGFVSLFNGKDLAGWDGRSNHWSVADGAITGVTTKDNPAKGNNFLIWKGGTVDDFELHATYKIVANNDKNPVSVACCQEGRDAVRISIRPIHPIR